MRTLGFKFKDLDFFDFNCEHFLFVKQKTKKVHGFHKEFSGSFKI